MLLWQGYVFAPVISLLEELGYVEGVDLIAASYDWRFAPLALEKRDGYFSQLTKSIETLDERCYGRGVVLLAHSMGNKVVSYFLEFAKKTKGQAWIDEHINLWIAAGAPHCGAPQALRSTVFGDKFGLDHFVTDSEADMFVARWKCIAFMILFAVCDQIIVEVHLSYQIGILNLLGQ